MIEKKGNVKIVVIAAIVLVILASIVYVFVFRGAKENKNTLQKVDLTENDQNILIDKDEVTIKKDDTNLYINDEPKIVIDENSEVLKTNELIFVLTKSQCLNSLTVFDKNGNVVGENYK